MSPARGEKQEAASRWTLIHRHKLKWPDEFSEKTWSLRKGTAMKTPERSCDHHHHHHHCRWKKRCGSQEWDAPTRRLQQHTNLTAACVNNNNKHLQPASVYSRCGRRRLFTSPQSHKQTAWVTSGAHKSGSDVQRSAARSHGNRYMTFSQVPSCLRGKERMNQRTEILLAHTYSHEFNIFTAKSNSRTRHCVCVCVCVEELYCLNVCLCVRQCGCVCVWGLHQTEWCMRMSKYSRASSDN